MPDTYDLNGLLQDILAADDALKTAQVRLEAAQRVHAGAQDALRTAQRRFDEAVAAARGIVPSVVEAAPVAIVEADETPRVAMGPLPPTSPALKPGWTGAASSAAADDDDRPDTVYEDA